jgi:carbon starvation protein
MRLGRPVVYTLAPLAFLLIMTVYALITQLRGFYEQGNYFLIVTDLLILAATIWVALEALAALMSARREERKTEDEVFAGEAPGG